MMLVDIGRMELREAPVPKVRPGTVLLKVMRASVCNGSDTALYSGRRKMAVAYPWMKLPYPIGHECCGEVVAAGEGVANWKVGDRVASLKYGGAFADYQIVDLQKDHGLVRMPQGMSWDEGTFLEPVFATNSYMSHIRKGDKVVLMGLGPSGVLLLQQSLLCGAQAVLCTDLHDLRLRVAAKLGAAATVNPTRQDLQAAVKDLFGEADVFIDATGQDVYDVGIRLLRNGGRVIAYGIPDSGVHYDGTRAYFRNIQIMPKVWDYPGTIRRVEELAARNVLDLTSFVTHRFPLQRAEEAVRMALERPQDVLAMKIDPTSTE